MCGIYLIKALLNICILMCYIPDVQSSLSISTITIAIDPSQYAFNLAEVSLYYQSIQISRSTLKFTLSSTYINDTVNFGANCCNDGVLTGGDLDICHSLPTVIDNVSIKYGIDANPTLTIQSSFVNTQLLVDQIVIYPRCCGGRERMNNAVVSFYSGNIPLWQYNIPSNYWTSSNGDIALSIKTPASPTVIPTTSPSLTPSIPTLIRTGTPTCTVSLCSTGQYATSTSTCAFCPVGKYTAYINQLTCLFCPAGTYNNNYSPGATSTCLVCPAGSYANSTLGASSCLLCPSGQYSPAGATACSICPAGLFSSAPGLGTCTPCFPGTQSKRGASICQSCSSQTTNTAFILNCSIIN